MTGPSRRRPAPPSSREDLRGGGACVPPEPGAQRRLNLSESWRMDGDTEGREAEELVLESAVGRLAEAQILETFLDALPVRAARAASSSCALVQLELSFWKETLRCTPALFPPLSAIVHVFSLSAAQAHILNHRSSPRVILPPSSQTSSNLLRAFNERSAAPCKKQRRKVFFLFLNNPACSQLLHCSCSQTHSLF